METYRVWLYGYSVVLLSLLVGFAYCLLHTVVASQWIALLPFSTSDAIWCFLYANLTLQALDVGLCLYGVSRSKPAVLQVFWVMGLVLLFGDVVYFGLSVPYWQHIINRAEQHLLETLTLRHDQPQFCTLLNGAQRQFACCGASGYTDFFELASLCDEPLAVNGSRLPRSCCPAEKALVCNTSSPELSTTGCGVPLLRWMIDKKDVLTLYGFCLMVLVKISGLVILKSEIRKLLVDVTARESVNTSLILRMVSVDDSAVASVVEPNQGDVVRSIVTYGRKSSRLERMFPFRQTYFEPASRRGSKTSFSQ